MILMIILGIISIILILYYNSNSNKREMTKKKTNIFSKLGYNYIETINVYYKGGLKNISSNTPTSVNLLQEGIGVISETQIEIIPFSNIIDMSLQNNQYIQSQISLGKLIVFGVLALGMKQSSNSINDEYIVLKIHDEDGEYNILLQAIDIKDNQEIYNKLLNYINDK